jgi:hypothetical protein
MPAASHASQATVMPKSLCYTLTKPTSTMAENDADREEILVPCLNILRRLPIGDAEKVRFRHLILGCQ